jgi:hypothetical protein
LHDYPAYGLFVGYQVKGYMACPLCGPNVETRCSIHLKKNVYLGHLQNLDRLHPYKRNHVVFNGQQEVRLEPPRVFASDFLKRLEEIERWLNMRTLARDDRENPIRSHGVKRKKHIFPITILGG